MEVQGLGGLQVRGQKGAAGLPTPGAGERCPLGL